MHCTQSCVGAACEFARWAVYDRQHMLGAGCRSLEPIKEPSKEDDFYYYNNFFFIGQGRQSTC